MSPQITRRGCDFFASDLVSVVPALLHYSNLSKKLWSVVVQKRGNHRDELGGVKKSQPRSVSEGGRSMALTLLSGTALAAGNGRTNSRISPAASAVPLSVFQLK